jgi:hypothetical protein
LLVRLDLFGVLRYDPGAVEILGIILVRGCFDYRPDALPCFIRGNKYMKNRLGISICNPGTLEAILYRLGILSKQAERIPRPVNNLRHSSIEEKVEA